MGLPDYPKVVLYPMDLSTMLVVPSGRNDGVEETGYKAVQFHPGSVLRHVRDSKGLHHL